MLKLNNRLYEVLKHNQPVVALESAVISLGLPRPHNLETALNCQRIIREKGATPATIGIINGTLVVGLSKDEIKILATDSECYKTNLSNFAGVMATGKNGATTVAATIFAAYKSGIRVVSTGGIGGVHPDYGSRLDISSDITALARFPVIVVCSGPKSLLDLVATREALETLGIPVIGYKTQYLPAFYLSHTDLTVDVEANSPAEVVAIAREHWQLGFNSAILVVQALPEDMALPAEILSAALATAQLRAQEQKVNQRQLTPFILRQLAELTEGATLRANIALLQNNAALAAAIACSISKSSQ
ncbi:MAG: pseudouridine-5'-phosphate glycosidase [Candidatus Sumerlaeia bacterium]|nr:pseudouridine-5'-phosphate glycosidase [Candidatus Sumerlaeia bacterium]